MAYYANLDLVGVQRQIVLARHQGDDASDFPMIPTPNPQHRGGYKPMDDRRKATTPKPLQPNLGKHLLYKKTNMSDQIPITDQHHNEYVASDANKGRIPGAEEATSGHHFISVFPKEGPHKESRGEKRAKEHLPPPTGRDQAPRGVQRETIPPVQGNTSNSTFTSHLPTIHKPLTPPPYKAPVPRAPAPGSRTVIDTDPYEAPATAAETITGSTSGDVHGRIGKPASGMTSAEMHHDGHQHRKRSLQGKDQYGTGDETH